MSVAIAHPDQPGLPGTFDVDDDAHGADQHSMSVPVGGGAVLRAGFLCPEEPPDPDYDPFAEG